MTARTRTAIALSLLGTVAWANAGEAQQATPAFGLEEIVVTARRREENIQTVPIAITAFTPEEIREKRITNAEDLTHFVPALTNFSATRDSLAFANIRGLPGVRQYFAGVPSGISGPASFYDLESVQVLVGPQGTLFGLNATGGAIVREPKRPSDRFEGYLQAQYGSYNQRWVQGAVNVPLAGDRLMVRLAGDRQVRDGFTTFVNTGEKVDDRNSWAGRLGVTFKPLDTVENYLVASIYKSDVNGTGTIINGINPAGFAARVYGLANLQRLVVQQQALGPRKLVGSNYVDGFEKNRSRQVIDTLSWEIAEDVAFKNIASLSISRGATNWDNDGTTADIIRFASPTFSSNVYTYTEEPQLQGKVFGSLDWVLGGFVSYTETPDPAQSCEGFSSFGSVGNCNTSDNKSRTQGIYGQATYDVGQAAAALEGLKVTFGYRYNWDFRSDWTQSRTRAGACAAVGSDANCVLQRTGKWKAPGWTAALEYQLSPGIFTYASIKRAYSSGGFNAVTLPEPLRIFGPEFNTDLEVGLKADWDVGAGRLRTNLALFRDWYQDVQRGTTVFSTDAAGVLRASTGTQNAAKMSVKGAELQFTYAPHESFDLSGNYQYLLIEYVKYATASTAGGTVGQVIDLTGIKVPNAAKHRGALTARYHLPIDPALGTASLAATASARSSYSVTEDINPFAQQKGYVQLDLRADWRDVGGYPIDLSVMATNLTDKVYQTGGLPVWTSIGFSASYLGEPRTFAVQVRYRFGD